MTERQCLRALMVESIGRLVDKGISKEIAVRPGKFPKGLLGRARYKLGTTKGGKIALLVP